MYLLTTRNFDGVAVDFYVDGYNNAEFWVTCQQIGRLLRYFGNPEKSIKRLHKLYSEKLLFSFREVEINSRYKGIDKVIVYNFDGLRKICFLSGRKNAAEVVNFLWEIKQEFEANQKLPAPKNELQPFNYGNSQVRVIERNGEFWFVAKDVCDILDIKNARDAINELYDNEKNPVAITDGNQNQRGNPNFNVINEPALYKLIFKSRKPEAKKFQDWVFYDILPTLRKQGTYTMGTRQRKELTGKATDTRFYSADELAAELGTNEYGVLSIARDNDLEMYRFFNPDNCFWYFTEEGREKVINAARL